jgi:hypothetical protein
MIIVLLQCNLVVFYTLNPERDQFFLHFYDYSEAYTETDKSFPANDFSSNDGLSALFTSITSFISPFSSLLLCQYLHSPIVYVILLLNKIFSNNLYIN